MESSLSLPMNLSRMDILATCSILNVLIFFFSAFKFHSSFVKFYSLVLFVVW